MNNKNLWFVIGLALIVIIVLMFRNPVETTTPFNDKPYLDSITSLVQANDLLHLKNDSLTLEYQSLEQQKSKIKIKYYKTYEYIKGASSSELDSIIQFNW